MADPDVTERSYPFASGQGQAITEDDWAAMVGTWQDDGVAFGLTVVPGPTQNTIQINPGLAAIDGFSYRLTAPKIMPTNANPDTVNRADLVVLRLDRTAEQIVSVVRDATPVSALGAGEVPLSTWTQLPTSSATPTNWGSATDARWFQGSRIRQAVANAQPPATIGGLMYVPGNGGAQGSFSLGVSNGSGGAKWTPWAPGGSWISAKDYGAVGDLVADDTAAIQAALNAAGTSGGVVVIPPGKYKITTFLTVKSDVTIYAYGAYLKAMGNSGLLRNFLGSDTFSAYSGNSRIKVFGGIWDGNAGSGANNTTTAETDVINFVHCRDIHVQDVIVRNVSSAHGLEFNSCDGAKAINCRFEGYRDNSGTSARQFSEAVQVDISVSGSSSIGAFDNTPSKNVLVEGCYMGPAVDGSGNGPFGKLVGSHTSAAGVYYDNIRVVNNVCDGGLDVGIRGYGWRRSVISGNVVVSTASHGIQIDTNGTDAIDSVIVANNVLVLTGGSGVAVNGAAGALATNIKVIGNTVNSATASNINLSYCDDGSVIGNTIRGGSSTGVLIQNGSGGVIDSNNINSTGSNCINVNAQSNVIISGNRARAPQSNYIVNVQSSHNCTITGNQFSDPQVNLACINFTVAAQFNMVTGNTFRRGATATAFVVRSNNSQTSPDASAYVNYVWGNDCKGFPDSADVKGSAGTSGGFAWITQRAGPVDNGVITKTTPSSTNAGANLVAGSPL